MGTQQKLPGLQMARAIAAGSIVYFHSWTILDRFPRGTAHPIPLLANYGWIGVDLFFAISGYVICLVIAKPNFSAREFLVKRTFRLYPLWLATLSIFGALAWAWRGFQPKETLGFFLYSTTLLPTHGFPFYDIGWSLQHEALFYVLACAVVPLFGLWSLALLLSLSAIAFHLFALPWFPADFMSYHAEFLAGVLAFIFAPRWKFGPTIPLALGVGTLWYFLFTFGGRAFFPIPLFFLVVAFVKMRSAPSLAVRLGDASYSMYLLHPLIFLIAKALTLHISTAIWAEEPIRFASFAIVIVAALSSWRLFESPLIRIGERCAAVSKNANDVVADDRRLDVGVRAAAARILDSDTGRG